ncbi:hypothetical protein TRIUR3_19781 [Triticum urartu]|uniref:DUF3615 domain-containing protein n=1 Tax=Triticum urartu TaxID=4572 RepID=M7YHR5_TRIUA|nr:hypothetical protein TRIUR3_19781 [Triticum urartu]
MDLSAAGQAGKHPYHLELASFLTSMPPQDTLLTGEATGKGYVISDAVLEQVYKIMEGKVVTTASLWNIYSIPSKLGKEPVPRLDAICGVKKGDHGHSKFDHVNFFVYYDDVSSARMLFFAEVWESSFQAKRSGPNTSVSLVTQPCTRKSRQVESGVQFIKVYSKSSRKQSKTSFCCPLPHYNPDHPYLGCCDVCEPISSKIAHPPFGNHIGANYKGLGELLEYLNKKLPIYSSTVKIVQVTLEVKITSRTSASEQQSSPLKRSSGYVIQVPQFPSNYEKKLVQMDAQVKDETCDHLSRAQFLHHRQCETSKELWDILEIINEGVSTQKEAHIDTLRAKFN